MQNKKWNRLKISFVAVLAVTWIPAQLCSVRSRYNCHAHSKRKETDGYIPDSDID